MSNFNLPVELQEKLEKVRRSGTGYMACCPAHNDRTPSLKIDAGKNGQLLYKCFAGCGFEDIIKALDMPPLKSIHSSVETDSRVIQRVKARATFDEARLIVESDPVFRYLTKTRGIPLSKPPDDVRYHPALEYWDTTGKRPVLRGEFDAMVAAARNLNREITGIHRTYLTPQGAKLSTAMNGIVDKKTQGNIKGSAVRLMPFEDILLLGEGIETALAAAAIMCQPAWSALNADNISVFSVPPGIKKLVLCIDNDKAGINAAMKFKQNNDCQIEVATWTGKGNDWCDALEVLTNA